LFANNKLNFYKTRLSQKLLNIKSKKWKRKDRWGSEFRRQECGRDKCDMGLLIV
jgi:hypothetical protein